MDSVFGGATSGPKISDQFINEVIHNYSELRNNFGSPEESPKMNDQDIGWRDDMKVLYYLSKVYCYYEDHKKFPVVNFRKLPAMHDGILEQR